MIETFVKYLETNRGLSPLTIEVYKKRLQRFARYLGEHYSGVRWSIVTKEMVDSYVTDLVDDGQAPASIKQHIAAIRTLYKTMQALGYQGENPARYVSTPKKAKRLPQTIEPEAITKALSSSSTPPQAKAIIAIIYETGVRLQELLDLQAADISSTDRSIKIHGKGRKERTVYYGELTKQYGGKLHSSSLTQRDARRLVWEALKPYSEAPQLSPHAIRHTFASRLLDKGAPIEFISKLLGHQNTNTTDIYAQLSNSRARELYNQYS